MFSSISGLMRSISTSFNYGRKDFKILSISVISTSSFLHQSSFGTGTEVVQTLPEENSRDTAKRPIPTSFLYGRKDLKILSIPVISRYVVLLRIPHSTEVVQTVPEETSRDTVKRPISTSFSYARKGLKILSNHGISKSSLLHKSSFSTEVGQTLPEEISRDTAKDETLDKLYKLIEVEIRGNDPAVLKSYAWYATTAADHLGIEVGKSWTPKKAHHERYTVLRSIHVNKKCRVQYEFRTYFHFMQFMRLTGSTADTFLEYIQRNLPEGVAMKVTKVSLEIMPDHIKIPEKGDLGAEAL